MVSVFALLRRLRRRSIDRGRQGGELRRDGPKHPKDEEVEDHRRCEALLHSRQRSRLLLSRRLSGGRGGRRGDGMEGLALELSGGGFDSEGEARLCLCDLSLHLLLEVLQLPPSENITIHRQLR